MVSPFEQRRQREIEEAWRHGMAKAERENRRPTGQTTDCCGVHVIWNSKREPFCSKCGKKNP